MMKAAMRMEAWCIAEETEEAARAQDTRGAGQRKNEQEYARLHLHEVCAVLTLSGASPFAAVGAVMRWLY
jgi:hypothetical protein